MRPLAFLDLLGPWKWPTLAAITVLPLAAFFLSWRDSDAGIGAAVYGPELLAGMPLVLLHPAGADPRAADVSWSARNCADCVARLQSLRLGYADCDHAPAQWVTAQGAAGRLTAVLPRAALAGARLCLWAELQTADSRAQHRWPLGTTP